MRPSRSRWVIVLAAAVVLLFLFGNLPTTFSGTGGGPPAPPTNATSHPSPDRPISHPAGIICPNPPTYPTYTEVGSVWPFDPPVEQQPCSPIEQDEVHASFTSDVPGSAEHWSIPVRLPALGPVGGQPTSYNDAYVGMVVTGDPNSAFHQSFVKVAFSPQNTGGVVQYTESVGILSFAFPSDYGGNCPGMNVTWNYTFYCEVNDLSFPNGMVLANGIPGNSWLNVSFAGTKGGASGLGIWVNDSTTPSFDRNLTLGGSATAPYTFEPEYSSSCPDYCYLNWTYPFGLGIGFDMCPTQVIGGQPGPTACNSYNETRWEVDPPVEFGIPHFFANGSYSGDYRFFSPDSTSGICNLYPPVGFAVAQCYNEDLFGGTAFYPIFSLNGSLLDFGGAFSWSKTTFGGTAGQFQATGLAQDIVPLFVNHVENDSLAGYLRSSTSLNVSAQAFVLGNLTNVSLEYSVSGGTLSAVPMAEAPGGNEQAGTFNGTVPASGGDGIISYKVVSRDSAGALVSSPTYSVVRGPLPTFDLGLQVRPTTCGSLLVNGTEYLNGSTAALLPGFYPATTTSCYPYEFERWAAAGAVGVLSPRNTSTLIAVSGNGSLAANWAWIRPHVTVTVHTQPSSCGAVTLNGTALTNGGSDVVYFGVPVPLRLSSSCAGYAFTGWTLTGNLTVLGSQLTAGGNGTLAANFIPSGTGNTLSFATAPANCGGILYRGAGYTNGQTLSVTATSYPIAADPCSHWGFASWNTSGGVTVSGSDVTVTGGGTLEEENYLLTEIDLLTFPSGCGTLSLDGVAYPGGSLVIVQNNSVHTIVATPCSGYHLINVTGTAGISLRGDQVTAAAAGGDLDAVFARGPDVVFLDFITQPAGCGGIVFEGTTYSNSQFVNVPPGTVAAISAVPCLNYGLAGWSSLGGITVAGSHVYVNGSGSVGAIFAPEVNVFVYTQPATCGTIRIGTTPYVSGSSAVVTETVGYAITVSPCPGMVFDGWRLTADANVSGGMLVVTGSAILTATFTAAVYRLDVAIDPGSCDFVTVGGAVVGNGTVLNLTAGNYSVAAHPCTGELLLGFSTAGNASLTGGTLALFGDTRLVATFGWVVPVVSLSVPPSAPAGTVVYVSAAVAVLVPPYDYAFTWNFGDGSSTTTTETNFTDHTYTRAGTYDIVVTVVDPHNRTATTSGSVLVLRSGGNVGGGVNWEATAIVLAGIGGVVLVAFVLSRRAPRATSGDSIETPDASPTPAAPGESDESSSDSV